MVGSGVMKLLVAGYGEVSNKGNSEEHKKIQIIKSVINLISNEFSNDTNVVSVLLIKKKKCQIYFLLFVSWLTTQI